MKSSYELAMERLNKTAPQKPLTAEQKAKIAELDSRFKARMAEREIFLKDELAKARAGRDYEAISQLEKQLASERKTLRQEFEEKKEAVHQETS